MKTFIAISKKIFRGSLSVIFSFSVIISIAFSSGIVYASLWEDFFQIEYEDEVRTNKVSDNQKTDNCFTKVDGQVIKSFYARNSHDCWYPHSMTRYKSACEISIYNQFFDKNTTKHTIEFIYPDKHIDSYNCED